MEETIIKLAEFGSVGVAFALIILVAYLLPKFINLIGNHFNHNTKVLTEVKGTLDKLDDTIERLVRKL